MRILCLHGHGANSDVTRTQIAPLRQALRRILGDDAKVDIAYLQGLTEAAPFPGVDKLFAPPFFKFWDGDSPSSVLAATERIASSISTNEPDVIFAHSDGAATALTTILHRSVHVKCLFLLCPLPPFDASGRRRLDGSLSDMPTFIRVPTIFLRGEEDPLAHFVDMTKGVLDEKNLTMFSWNGGHFAPSSRERSLWAQIAQKMVEILTND